MLERGVPVENDVDGHAFPAKPGADRLGQDLEVFNYQHSHDLFVILLRGGCPANRRGYVTWSRHCQVAGVRPVSAADTVLTPAVA
jgi:hypothetical protein